MVTIIIRPLEIKLFSLISTAVLMELDPCPDLTKPPLHPSTGLAFLSFVHFPISAFDRCKGDIIAFVFRSAVFPMSPEKVHIADEALNRVSSCNGDGIYSQQRSKSTAEVKQHAVSEKEITDGGDERDIRKKQVETMSSLVVCTYFTHPS